MEKKTMTPKLIESMKMIASLEIHNGDGPVVSQIITKAREILDDLGVEYKTGEANE